MPDLLLELFSEEIPARMQSQAAKDLERLVVGALTDRGLNFESVKSFAGPRRLTLAMFGLPAKQPDVSEEKKGPRVNAPAKAIEGFLRSAGVKLEQCEKRDDGKGEFYVAVIARKGRATAEVLAEVLPECIAKLPWPKSMRFPGSAQRWVRPLHSILCVLDGKVVPFEFAGVKSGCTTLGHRFLSKDTIEARNFDEYVKKLRAAHVIVDAAERKAIILRDAKAKAVTLGLELIEDEGLLEEVAGLNEWPVVLIGKIEDHFTDMPPEILQTSMRMHQKYFSLRDAKTGKMANRFVVVANMVTTDGGKEIVAGNERVLRARLSDAKFFWDQDRKHTLESRVDALKGVVFHAKLGTQYERVERIEALAGEIAAKIGADVAKAKRAARLCKADLTTEVVGEFPELQGVMGRYYRLHDDPTDVEVADAIRDHYKPLGPNDAVPTNKVSIAVALADKLDSLVGFFVVGERPTGSGDPLALRRATLGVISLLTENSIRLSLVDTISTALLSIGTALGTKIAIAELTTKHAAVESVFGSGLAGRAAKSVVARSGAMSERILEKLWPRLDEAVLTLLSFIGGRLRVSLREKGMRHDLMDAMFNLENEDDLVRVVARVEALQRFLKTEDGADLLVAYRRAANILRIEEKRDNVSYDGDPDPDIFVLPEEKALYVELATAGELVRAEIERERFVEAMSVMARLRPPVDAFFDKVTVNDKDLEKRKNRLLLLSRLRVTLHLVADFSKIEG